MVSEVLILLPPHPAAFFLFCFFGGLKCSLCPKNQDFQNLSLLGLPPDHLAQKIEIFEILTFFGVVVVVSSALKIEIFKIWAFLVICGTKKAQNLT